MTASASRLPTLSLLVHVHGVVNGRQQRDACEGLHLCIDSISTLLFQAVGRSRAWGRHKNRPILASVGEVWAKRGRRFFPQSFSRDMAVGAVGGSTNQPHRVLIPGGVQLKRCRLRMASRTERLDRALATAQVTVSLKPSPNRQSNRPSANPTLWDASRADGRPNAGTMQVHQREPLDAEPKFRRAAPLSLNLSPSLSKPSLQPLKARPSPTTAGGKCHRRWATCSHAGFAVAPRRFSARPPAPGSVFGFLLAFPKSKLS